MKPATLPRVFQPFDCNDLVRLGKDNDGGYLINREDIVNATKLISFGINEDWSFEEDFLAVNPCALDAYDNSISAEKFSADPAKKDVYKSYTEFFTGNRRHIEKNIGNLNRDDHMSFASVVDGAGDGIFLKCDIEKSEYEFLDELIVRASQFIGLAIEFHNINQHDNFNSLTNFISKVDLRLVHLHCNNWAYFKTPNGGFQPDCLELTFTASPNVEYRPRLRMPRSLDMPNNPNDDDFEIYF